MPDIEQLRRWRKRLRRYSGPPTLSAKELRIAKEEGIVIAFYEDDILSLSGALSTEFFASSQTAVRFDGVGPLLDEWELDEEDDCFVFVRSRMPKIPPLSSARIVLRFDGLSRVWEVNVAGRSSVSFRYKLDDGFLCFGAIFFLEG